MSLDYTVWTEEAVENRGVSPEGDYPFEILKAVATKTKAKTDENGQPKPIYNMLELDFNYYDIHGQSKKLRDWVVFAPGMDWKFRHLADTIGQLALYEAKELDVAHIIRKKGVFKLGVKDYLGNDGVNRKQNFVKDYVKQAAPIDSFDDDIPAM